MIAAVSRKSSSSKPRIVIAGVPMRTPEATVGGRSSNGTVLRFTVICTSCSRSSAALPVHSELRRSICMRCVSVPPVRMLEAALLQRLREHVGVRRTCRWYSRNASVPAILKHVAFAAIVCIERPALHAREHGPVDRRGMLLAAEDESRARACERLVRRRRDEVAVLDGVRMQPRRDEPGEVRHVAEQQRPDLVGDLAELVRLDGARIRGAAADDQLRPAPSPASSTSS